MQPVAERARSSWRPARGWHLCYESQGLRSHRFEVSAARGNLNGARRAPPSRPVRLRPAWPRIKAFAFSRPLGELRGARRRLHSGAIAFGSLLGATVASVWMNGVMMVVAGAAEIGMGLHMKNWGRLILLCAAGALLLVAGVLCVLNPLLAAVALTLCLGAGLCATGLVRIYVASQMDRTRLGGSRCCPASSPSSSA